MNDLLRDFLTEAQESLDVVDVELVRFEREPNNAEILSRIFRLVHTIKGTCGFLGLPRLEALTHAAESLMGQFRSGMPVTQDAVSLILAVIDRIKEILTELERSRREPSGDDDDLIRELERAAYGEASAAGASAGPGANVGTLVYQVLERPLRPGEVPLDELERAFRETSGPVPTPAPARAGDDDRRIGQERREDDDRREGAVRPQTLRIQVDTLERLMTMVSELVLTRNQLSEIMRRSENSDLNAPFQRLSNITGELQEGVMKTRMQPIGNAWAKLPRIVRDLSTELGKKIELVMEGEDTELDRQMLELVKDPLTHMVRNSADHGIEKPAARRAAGKPEHGTIRLSAFYEGGHVIIEIADDGRGLDAGRIRAKAVRLGLVSEAEAEKLTDTQIYRFIFAPGFTTATQVTSVSGRGVGMDVVKANIDQIGGTIDLKSVFGQGTTLRVKIPLTLAIVPALIVGTNGERFAIPQIAVMELVRVNGGSEHRIERIKEASVLRLRDQLLPVEYLGSFVAAPVSERRAGRALRRGDAGRPAPVRDCGRSGAAHRGDRGQADVRAAAVRRHVLGQHDSGRRIGDHDPGSQRDRVRDWRQCGGECGPARARGTGRERFGSVDGVAPVPCRVGRVQGGSDFARNPDRGGGCAPDRGLGQPPHDPVSRRPDAAPAGRFECARSERRLPAVARVRR